MRFVLTTTSLLLLGAVVCPAAASSEGGGGGSALIEPQIGTIFWTLVTFLLLALLLGRFAWKPLLASLDAREKSISDSIAQAAKDREEAHGLVEEQREMLVQARRERAEAVAKGQRDADKLKEEILGETRQQQEQVLQQTQVRIEQEMREARAELRQVTVDLSIRAAEKLLSRNLDDATQRELVENYLVDLEGSDGSGSLPS